MVSRSCDITNRGVFFPAALNEIIQVNSTFVWSWHIQCLSWYCIYVQRHTMPNLVESQTAISYKTVCKKQPI